MEKNYRELYEKITKSDWFKKVYQDKSLGVCPIVVEELEESEDERIRKGLINFLQSPFIKENLTDEKVAPWIAYLEKQKKQKSIISAEESLGISQEEYNKIVDKCIFGEQKEQKLIEWSDSFEENIRILLHDKLTWHSEDGSMSSTILIDDKTLRDIVNGIWFYVGKEALKYPNKELNAAKWSEEDKATIKEICDFLYETSIGVYRSIEKDTFKRWIDCLKSL